MEKTEKARETTTTKLHDDILKKDSESALYDAMLCCKTADECRAFLTDLCTRQEVAALSERWVIARLLAAGGLSYRDISAATGASTTTVGRVARFLQQEPHKGYQLVLERIGDKRNDKKSNPK